MLGPFHILRRRGVTNVLNKWIILTAYFLSRTYLSIQEVIADDGLSTI